MVALRRLAGRCVDGRRGHRLRDLEPLDELRRQGAAPRRPERAGGAVSDPRTRAPAPPRCPARRSDRGHLMATLYTGTSGFAYPAWKPGFYPSTVPAAKFLEYYAYAAQLRRDQLHLQAHARRIHTAVVGRPHPRGLRLRRQGPPADHALSPPQGRRRAHAGVPRRPGAAARRRQARSRAVPASAAPEGRRGAARCLSRAAAARLEIRLRVPRRLVVRRRRVRAARRARRVAVRGRVRQAGSARCRHRRLRLLPLEEADLRRGRHRRRRRSLAGAAEPAAATCTCSSSTRTTRREPSTRNGCSRRRSRGCACAVGAEPPSACTARLRR